MLLDRHEELGQHHATIEQRLAFIEGQLGSLEYMNDAMDGALARCQKRREVFAHAAFNTRSAGALLESLADGELRTPERRDRSQRDFGEHRSSAKSGRSSKGKPLPFGPWMEDGKTERLERHWRKSPNDLALTI